MSDSDEEDVQPKKSKQNHGYPSLPVQLTWKGVQIYFPSVTLTKDLKDKADEALKKKIAKEASLEQENNEDSSEDSNDDTENADKTAKKLTATTSKSTPPSQLYECSKCDRKFSRQYNLKQHLKKHAKRNVVKKKGRFGPCKCGAYFTQSSNLSRHKRLNRCPAINAADKGAVINDDTVNDENDTETSDKEEEEEGNWSSSEKGTEVKVEKEDSDHEEDVDLDDASSQDNINNKVKVEREDDDNYNDAASERSYFNDHNEETPTENHPNNNVSKSWGDAYLKSYKERPSSMLNPQSLKEKVREMFLANKSNDSTNKNDIDESQISDDHVPSDFNPILTSVTSISKNKCPHCGSLFENSILFSNHSKICKRMTESKTADGRIRRFHCTKCPWKFLALTVLRRHERGHLGLRDFHCPKCFKTFKEKHHCSRHQENCRVTPKLSNDKLNDKSNNSTVQCKLCYRSFTNERYLKVHALTHENDSNKAQEEEDDDEHFDNDFAAQEEDEDDSNHIITNVRTLSSQENVDQQFKKFQCNLCQKSFSCDKYLQQHSKTHQHSLALQGRLTASNSSSVKCEKCARRFSGLGYLKQHLKSCRSKAPIIPSIKNFNNELQCQICQQILTNTFNLARHVKAHTCKDCGIQFPSLRGKERDMHASTCTGGTLQNNQSEEPETVSISRFNCEACGRGFKYNSDYVRHIQRHLKEGSTLPPEEKEESTSPPSDRRTSRSSTAAAKESLNQSNYVCDLCGKSFNDKVELSRHCLSHVIGKELATGFEFEQRPAAASNAPSRGRPGPLSRKAGPLSSKSLKMPMLIPVSNLNPTPPPPIAAGLIYTCKFKDCTHFFSHDEDLWYHIEKKHIKLGNLCCGKCGLDFDNVSSLEIHSKKEHEIIPEIPKLFKNSVGTTDEEKVKVKPPGKEKSSTLLSNLKIENPLEESDPLSNNVIVSVKKEPKEPNENETPQFNVDDNYEDTQQNDDDYIDPAMLIPQTELVEIGDTQSRPNPHILITADLKDAAEAYLNCTDAESMIRRQGKFREDVPLADFYTCEHCPDLRTFYDRHRYILHLNYHEKQKRMGVEGNAKKRSPRRTHIPIQDVYTCQECDRSFYNRGNFFSHLYYHDTQRNREPSSRGRKPKREIPFQDIYTCELCKPEVKTFTQRPSYISHLNYHDVIQKKGRTTIDNSKRFREDIPRQDVYTCETCDNRQFLKRQDYISHLHYHKRMGVDRILYEKGKHPRQLRRDDIPLSDIYTCDLCEGEEKTTFTERARYITHLNYHEQSRNKVLNRNISRRRRRRGQNSLPEIPFLDEYTCSTCKDRTFTDRKSYIGHLMYHRILKKKGIHRAIVRREDMEYSKSQNDIPEMDVYTCNTCNGRTFTSRNSYLSHVQYHNTLKREGRNRVITPLRKRKRDDVPIADIYTCEKCEEKRTFTDRTQYINHINYHERQALIGRDSRIPQKRGPKFHSKVPFQNVYRCKLCTSEIRTFTERAKYIAHLNYHTVKKRMMASALNSGLLQSQRQRPGPLSSKIIKTPSNTTDFSSSSDVLEVLDSGKERYHCKICGEDKIFSSRKGFAKHMKCHEVMKNKDFQCSICEKAFSSMWNLSLHAKTHTGDKTSICGDCGKRFSANSILKRHQDKFCKKVPCKYTCHCGDKFHTIQILELHVKKYHTGVETQQRKNFRCYVCNSEFIQAFELNNHVRDLHPDDYKEFMQMKASQSTSSAPVASTSLGESSAPTLSWVDDDDAGNNFSEEIQIINMDTDENNVINLPSQDGGWNFIPELAENCEEEDDDVIENQGEFYSEFIPESYEPEDVEFAGSSQVVNLNFMERFNQDQRDSSQPALAKKKRAPTKRKATDVVRYQCGYCDKTSHKVAYIKSHFTVTHQGLPFKFKDLEAESPNNNDSNSNSNSNEGDESQKQGPTCPATLVTSTAAAAVGPQPQGKIPSVESNNESSSARFKRVKLTGECSCHIQDSVLGYLKRCVGEDCLCYANTKGCSDNCQCKGSCNNPYFRSKVVTSKTLPDLVPVSTNNHITAAYPTGTIIFTQTQGSLTNYYGVQTYNPNQNQQQVNSTPNINRDLPVNYLLPRPNNMAQKNHIIGTPRILQRSVAKQPVVTVNNQRFMILNSSQSIAPQVNIQTNSGTLLSEMLSSPAQNQNPQPTINTTVPLGQGYNCNFCNEYFTSLPSYLTHQWTHKNEKEFICPVYDCDKKFSALSHLMLHSRSHFKTSEPSQTTPCIACTALLKNKEELDMHFKLYHKALICPTCQLYCRTRDDFILHNRTHTYQTSFPEVIDLEDYVERPMSPSFPVIVSVAGTSFSNSYNGQ